MAYKIKNILDSLADSVNAKEMTIEQAAIELCRAGWMNFVDVEKAKRLLNL